MLSSFVEQYSVIVATDTIVHGVHEFYFVSSASICYSPNQKLKGWSHSGINELKVSLRIRELLNTSYDYGMMKAYVIISYRFISWD